MFGVTNILSYLFCLSYVILLIFKLCVLEYGNSVGYAEKSAVEGKRE